MNGAEVAVLVCLVVVVIAATCWHIREMRLINAVIRQAEASFQRTHRGNGVNATISRGIQGARAEAAQIRAEARAEQASRHQPEPCDRCHDLELSDLAEFRVWRLENDRPISGQAEK